MGAPSQLEACVSSPVKTDPSAVGEGSPIFLRLSAGRGRDVVWTGLAEIGKPNSSAPRTEAVCRLVAGVCTRTSEQVGQ